jgi:hypothetical protein
MRRRQLAALAIAAALFASCGSSSSEADKTGAFVGPWTVNMGAVTGNCPTLGMVNFKLDGAVQTIVKGTDSDLAVTLLTGCTVKMDVAGSVATVRTTPAQTCMISLPQGFPITATFTGGTFTVAGTTAMFNFSGTGALGALSCPVMGTGTSTKGAPADGGATADGSLAPDAATAASD